MSKQAMKLALEHIEGNYTVSAEDAIKALEEALAKQEQGEAVAYRFKERPDDLRSGWHYVGKEKHVPYGWPNQPLYTTPQQRKPLTDEQILNSARDHYNPHQRAEISFARAIEAAHGIGDKT